MLFSLLLQLLCFSTLATARDKKPVEVTPTQLDNAPASLHYFEDSDVVLLHDRVSGIVHRSDDAGKRWHPIQDVEEGAALELWPHPYDRKVAYILGGRTMHWVTQDKGENWRSFETEASPSLFRTPFTFHAGDSDKVLYHGQKCKNVLDCTEYSYYTKDAFEHISVMREKTRGCTFTHATLLSEASNDDTIICVVQGKFSGWPEENRLVVSDDYFKTESEPSLEGERTVQGIINIAPVKRFIVAAAKAKGTSELALYVTEDAQTWHRAVFPDDHRLEEDAYTILESTSYSIQVDVMTTKPAEAMGVLCTSNSNGTYFSINKEHTNRNVRGFVDFEKIQGIQGIVLVNTVDNWQEVEKFHKDKKLVSQISFDDGRTFRNLTADGKNLHLHSVTDMSNTGRIFSSPAPGLVMGVGNTGKHLKRYEECDTWVSDDAGVTWTMALPEAHKYEFGDQGALLVAVYDEGPTDEISYSIDHGLNWEKANLGEKVKAQALTTTPDSTSLKFLLLATKGSGASLEHYSFFLDFDNVFDRTCKEGDFEIWNAREDEKGEPDCLMGHTQYYRRRKADAKCSVDHEFKEAKPQNETCACTAEDYECDFNFIRSEDKKYCNPTDGHAIQLPKDACKDNEDTFKGPSGFRKIPGNDCDHNKGVKLDEYIDRPCNESMKPPTNKEITHETTTFKASGFREYYYLERAESNSGGDETVIMRTSEQQIWLSKDHGKTWKHILKGEEITAIYPHQYDNNYVYFLTGGEKAWYSIHRGDKIEEFKTPSEPTRDRVQTLAFHPDYKDWMLWTGAVDCDSKGDCHSEAFRTEDRGTEWHKMLRYVRKCEFIKREGRGDNKKLVYCEQYKDEMLDGPLELLSSDNWFADSETKFSNVIDFATMSEFIIVASKDQQDEKSLRVGASVDGKTFAAAEFPSNFNVPVQKAYTVLDSSTHAVFLHVTVGSRQDSEYGTIIKSNSNGTSYVLSISGVNRNTQGYVDFEKMLGLEGVAIVNVVDNIQDAERGNPKKLKTMITHNDGAEWAPIQAPEKDEDGKPFNCDAAAQCSLHLHGYTERDDPRDTFSSPSAVGLMMGVGNVGEHLGRKGDEDTHTFLTRDGGVEWTAVMKGYYMWEFGDQGSIIVIVEAKKATDVVYYTLDEGKEWKKYKFTESQMEIGSITTVPSDTSRNFLLWGRDVNSNGEIATVNLDFTGLRDRQCELNDKDPEESPDYELWEPKHPQSKNNCLFGHIARYHRKKVDAQCFNGRRYESLHDITDEHCPCTRQDFEW